ncbi:hypothetical protein J6590_016470 [Homalodisca vitripennis]|nr:hypothetical protein J6590_016470 [Homalodisca vitripennis]
MTCTVGSALSHSNVTDEEVVTRRDREFLRHSLARCPVSLPSEALCFGRCGNKTDLMSEDKELAESCPSIVTSPAFITDSYILLSPSPPPLALALPILSSDTNNFLRSYILYALSVPDACLLYFRNHKY